MIRALLPGAAFRTEIQGRRKKKKARPLSGPGFSLSHVRSGLVPRLLAYGVGNVRNTSVRFARILPPFKTMWLAAALLSWQ